jgi:hypothetical protein
VWSVLRLYNDDQVPLLDILETAVRRVGGWCEMAGMVESVERCSCEKWEAGSWGQGQFRNPEEGEHLLLEATTKQGLVKTQCVHVCCSYSYLWSV